MIHRHTIIGTSIALLLASSHATGFNIVSELPTPSPMMAVSSRPAPLGQSIRWESEPFISTPTIEEIPGLFRGIPRDQGNNLLFSNSLNRLNDLGTPYYIDVLDNFGRSTPLLNSEADTLQIGFVPPIANVPDGLLEGQNAIDHGRWAYGSDYITSADNGGFVSRNTLDGSGIAATPWRVYPGLGDYYLLEMQANVAAGEAVTLAYMGDVETIGTAQGLSGALAQLLLQVTRGSGEEENVLTWTLSWDQSGTPRSFSSTTSAEVDELLNLQLGWLDLRFQGDLFDAWLGDANNNTRLASGSLDADLDVFDVGFHVSGLQSTVHRFIAAVPEPSSLPLSVLGMTCLLLMQGRRTIRQHAVLAAA